MFKSGYWVKSLFRNTGRLVFRVIRKSGLHITLREGKLSEVLYSRRILIKGPSIVAIGGGTGLSTLLRGLKRYSENITAVVTVADDGGGSGILRQDLKILPPGDIRNCILAMADTEPTMQKLLKYRFTEGALKGQSFGNLFLAAMDGISESFEEAVKKMSEVLKVKGRVLPVTLEDIKLHAILEDGHRICGESEIGRHNCLHPGKIDRVYLEPENAQPLEEVLDAIREADAVLIGPGSLYTSVIPNLLVKKVALEIEKSRALKINIMNIMTQPGETDRYRASHHMEAIYRHTGKTLADLVIVNGSKVPAELKEKYAREGSEPVETDRHRLREMGIPVIESEIASHEQGFARHNPDKLAALIIAIINERVLKKDINRRIDYYFLCKCLKDKGYSYDEIWSK